MTTYYQNEFFNPSSVFDELGKIDEEYEALKEKGELNDEDLFRLNYQKFIKGLKLNTGYVKF